MRRVLNAMPEYYRRLTQKLFQPVDAASLGFFRILFGALMTWQAVYFLQGDRYVHDYLLPRFHFTYEFFAFVKPVGPEFLKALFWTMALSGLGVMVGICYRLFAFLFFATFTNAFLLDKAYYNNHYYFISLIAFWMILVDAQRWASLSQRFRPRPAYVPYWNLLILKVQVVIVYFYGGIAKLNGDWLRGDPMRFWLSRLGDLPVVGPWLLSDWAPYFFSWGGLAYDLAIGFLLWWRKTRWAAFLAVLFFNLSNSVLFTIGVFPFLMIAAATLFDEPDWPRRFFKFKGALPKKFAFPVRHGVAVFLGLYLLVQVAVPLRHWLIAGDVHWTEEGHLFSWRMKLRDKQGVLKITVTDPATGRSFAVDPLQEINRFQYRKLMQRPQFIHQYAQHLKARFQKEEIADPVITVDSRVSLNGRPFQMLIDPTVDLAKAPMRFFSHDPWILPLPENARPGALGTPGLAKESDADLESDR